MQTPLHLSSQLQSILLLGIVEQQIYVDPTTLIQPSTIYSSTRYTRMVDICRPKHTYPALYYLFIHQVWYSRIVNICRPHYSYPAFYYLFIYQVQQNSIYMNVDPTKLIYPSGLYCLFMQVCIEQHPYEKDDDKTIKTCLL